MMGMMAGGLEVFELLELALLLLAVGALSGFLAGVFGIGGGAILVPVFYECFGLAGVPLDVRMPLCVGTSLAIIIPTSIRSWRAHYVRGAVDTDILKPWCAGAGRRDRRQHHRTLRTGAPVQNCVPDGGMVGRDASVAGARDLELGRRPAERVVDENLRLFRRNSFHPDGHRRRTVLEPADDFLWPSYPSGRRDLVGAGGIDLDSRHHRVCLCRMARRGALSGSDRAAITVRAGLRLADRCGACDAKQPVDRPARGESRPCDVEAQAGDGVWTLSVCRWRPVRDQPVVMHKGLRGASSKKAWHRYRGEYSSVPCPSHCVAIHPPRSLAWAF